MGAAVASGGARRIDAIDAAPLVVGSSPPRIEIISGIPPRAPRRVGSDVPCPRSTPEGVPQTELCHRSPGGWLEPWRRNLSCAGALLRSFGVNSCPTAGILGGDKRDKGNSAHSPMSAGGDPDFA